MNYSGGKYNAEDTGADKRFQDIISPSQVYTSTTTQGKDISTMWRTMKGSNTAAAAAAV